MRMPQKSKQQKMLNIHYNRDYKRKHYNGSLSIKYRYANCSTKTTALHFVKIPRKMQRILSRFL